MNDVVEQSLWFRLSAEAERARWQLDEIAWARIDRERATPALRALVREIAYSELTTNTATRRFLAEFADDADFSQWISVWFYEETRHPQVLLRWLNEVGDPVDDRFILRGRATAPFMKSRFGTLVTNIISELAASSAYAGLCAGAGEPVLERIARELSADEARHAASFFAYARRHLERSSDPDSDRRDAIKVLYLWLQDGASVRHPVNEFYARNRDAMTELAFEPVLPRDRIAGVIGALLEMPLTASSDLLAYLDATPRTIGGRG